jgi:hypothetical protein
MRIAAIPKLMSMVDMVTVTATVATVKPTIDRMEQEEDEKMTRNKSREVQIPQEKRMMKMNIVMLRLIFHTERNPTTCTAMEM